MRSNQNKKLVKKLSVTISMISYNDANIIDDCLKSIRNQDYGGEVKILMVDGGSTDSTVEIAKRYGAKVIFKPQYLDKPYKRGDIALNSVKTDIAIFFSADNRFQETDCLKKIMKPFEDEEISAVETFKYGYDKKSSILTKYFALIGGTDPIAVSLGKADRAAQDISNWHSFGQVIENSQYFKVNFEDDISRIPTLGANGFAIRNKLIKRFPINNSLHIELCTQLIMKGYNKFAFVKDVHIIHEIQSSIFELLKRKLMWKKLYSNINIRRKYLVYNPKSDKLKLALIVLSSITLVTPIYRTIKGFIKKPELAWLLHPLILNLFIFSYGLSIFKSALQNNHLIKRSI